MKKFINRLGERIVLGVSLLMLLGMASSAGAYTTLVLSEPRDIIRTLKFLRNPQYASVTPALLPLLSNKDANVVRDTCRTLAVIAGKDVIPNIEPLLTDNRADVRKDARDAIDRLRADPRPPYTKPSPTLDSFDPKDTIRTLKLLRSPEFAATIPAILPLLHHEKPNVVRDACRTLAVIATKDYIPSIEPLLDDKREAVRKDAQDAINILRAKP